MSQLLADTQALAGCYRYWRDGVCQTIEEPWQWRPTPQGSQLSGQRIVDGRPVLDILAEYRNGRCSEMTLRWGGDEETGLWHYQQQDDQLVWARDGEPPRHLKLPPDCLLFPLLRAATGPLLPRLAAAPCDLVLPRLHDPFAADFLQPVLSARHAVPSKNPDHFRYFGGEYGAAGSDYWLNPSGLVSRYLWSSPQGKWDVRLESAQQPGTP